MTATTWEERVRAEAADAMAKPKGDTPGAGYLPDAIDLEALSKIEPLPPKFISVGIPAGYATLSTGHGGQGKSTIELHRAICIALGKPFFGLVTEQKNVLFLSCEDRVDVLHYRIKNICASLGVSMAPLVGKLQMIDVVGHDSVLFAPSPNFPSALTTIYETLKERIAEYASEVVFLDGVADVYAGNENDRGQVKQFVNAVLALVPKDGAVIAIGHINKNSAKSGSKDEGYSGSTGWHNSCRARWFLYRESLGDDDDDDSDLILELMKSNLGEGKTQVRLRWDEARHTFTGKAKVRAEPDLIARDREERLAVLKALYACSQATPPITVSSAKSGTRNASRVLSTRPDFPRHLLNSKPGKKRFWRHLEQLRQFRLIDVVENRRNNRHFSCELVLTTEGVRQCVAI